jgi:hypothetical protein
LLWCSSAARFQLETVNTERSGKLHRGNHSLARWGIAVMRDRLTLGYGILCGTEQISLRGPRILARGALQASGYPTVAC